MIRYCEELDIKCNENIIYCLKMTLLLFLLIKEIKIK